MVRTVESVDPTLNSCSNPGSEGQNAKIIPFDPYRLGLEERELSFGQYLRRERVLRGISREEIIRVTKVSPEYYDALERNAFEILPPKAFVIGFLKVLSEYAGFDEAEVKNRYLSELVLEEEARTVKKPTLFQRYGKYFFVALGTAALTALVVAPLYLK